MNNSSGIHLNKEYRKFFKVESADYKSPNIKKWKIYPPKKNTSEPVVVDLNGKMDHISLAYRLRILDKKGNEINGVINVQNHQQQWKFTPKVKWESSIYYLEIDTMLEDIAGNRLSGLFDQPSLAKESEFKNKKLRLAFKVINIGS